MDEMQALLSESATRLFADNHDIALKSEYQFDQTLWETVQELGFTMLLVSEEKGGTESPWSYAQTILQPAGYHSIPLPCAEAMLAAYLLDIAGVELDSSLAIAAPSQGALAKNGDTYTFQGKVRGTPWGRYADTVVTSSDFEGSCYIVILKRDTGEIREATNLAGEPRDEIAFDSCPAIAVPSNDIAANNLQEYSALLRLSQILGAMEYALKMSVDYANERKQFGRQIGKFQAVQQQLAIFSSEVAAVSCAVRAAFDAADCGGASFQVAAAKLRANMAIGIATATAHQVHAAIGFTEEHSLRLATQRLLSWRSEYGNDAFWSNRLGQSVARRGAEHFWSDLTTRDDRVSIA